MPELQRRTREILVVDDMPEICEFFSSLMRRAQHSDVRVTTEINSDRAVALVKERRYDLVISDFRMRQVDGATVLAAARASNPDGVRVLMTGYGEVTAATERLRNAGVDAYVPKPLRSHDLFLLVLDLLNREEATLAACRAHARNVEATGQVARA